MSQPDDATPVLDFEHLADVLCAITIRSGDLLELDKIADLPPADRAIKVVMTINRAAEADPWIADVLMKVGALPILRQEYLQRKKVA